MPAESIAGNREHNNGLGIVGSALMLILAPLAAMIVQMATSRTREYAADNYRRSRQRSARRL